MELRQLGQSELRVPPLMLGGNVFGWTIDEQRSFEVLDAAFAAGLNFIDTADIYSRWADGHEGGESETIIGKWLQRTGNRDRVIIATKVAGEMGPGKKGLGRDYIIRAAEDSLRRLQTDHIDLYQSHFDDAATPLDETLAAFNQLMKDGKVRVIGASNYSADRLREAQNSASRNGLTGYQTLQPHYNLYDRSDYESGLEAVCEELSLGVVPYFALASGFLTGKYRSEEDLSKSPRGQGNSKYLNARGYKILAALDQVAAETGANPGQVALSWLIARPGITAPIASATSIEQVDDLKAATQLTLSESQIGILSDASS